MISFQVRRPGRFLALFCLLLLPNGCSDSHSKPSDVIVIVIDTLRPDHLGLYGHDRETAPFLTELATRSAVFTRAFSTSSWTAPSTASIFTSLFPLEHGVVEGLMVREKRAIEIAKTGKTALPLNRIPDDVQTLPSLFREAGYQTFGLGANANIGPEMGFDRGFDRFARLHDSPAEALFGQLRRWEDGFDRSKPKFVYLHFDDVHAPYQRRSPWFEASGNTLTDLESAYDSEISYLDSVLRQMFDHFGWNEEAIVVIASDHGEEFMEHGQLGHRPSLYRELLHVLLLVRAPRMEWEGQRIDWNVTTLDVLPTLAELAGLEIRRQWQGRSVVPLLEGSTPPSQRTLFSHRTPQDPGQGELWAAVSDDWHLIDRGGELELYHLENDPEERLDLSEARRDVRDRLARELGDFRTSARARQRTEPFEYEVDEEKLEELRALGYAE